MSQSFQIESDGGMPANIRLSFGIDLPALALSAPVILLIQRDPIWKEKET